MMKNAKKLLGLIAILYLIAAGLIWKSLPGPDPDRLGNLLVILTYLAALLASLVLKFTNGKGIRFKRPSFINPIDRARTFAKALPLAQGLLVLGALLSLFLYRNRLSYMYDFVTLLVVLLLSWNLVILMGDRIEQLKDKKRGFKK